MEKIAPVERGTSRQLLKCVRRFAGWAEVVVAQ